MRTSGLVSVVLGLGLVGVVGCSGSSRAPNRDVDPPAYDRTIRLARRIPHLETYPCGEECHADRESDATPRELTEFHTTIAIDHGPAAQWCDFCHRIEDADRLRLINDETITFDQSDRLCGQCHAEKHADWAAGIHSLETGTWGGDALRRSCTACHDPHAPGPITFQALPPPPRPGAH